MSKERVQIDQALCDLVKYVLQGGASVSKASMMTGISTATVSRIRNAEFSADRYMENTKKRLKDERIQKRLADQKMPELETEIPGQMEMDLPEVKRWNPQTGKIETFTVKDVNTMMRFQAAMTEKILNKMEKLNDTLNQLIRCVRKE